MKLICAGLPKTGTTSMANALRILGYKVYDFPEHFDLHVDEWFAMYRGEKTPDFVAMYEGVDAVTDLPPAFWYEELLQAFPDARVILTVRDSDEVWMQSLVNNRRQLQGQIRLFMLASLATLLSAKVRKVRNLVRMEVVAAYGAANATASLYKKKYKEHNERVQAVIPKEKLFVFNVKQGWDPLCEFLGVDVPSQEFPRANVASSVTLDYMTRMCRESMWETIIYVILPVVVIILSIMVYSFYK